MKDCDIDDGLALLFLLGSPGVRLLGVTCTYGNSDVEAVYGNTVSMLRDLGKTDLPVVKGCPDARSQESDAVEFLLEEAKRHSGDVALLATGSLTNLYAAWKQDNGFLKHFTSISLMGGLTEPLFVGNAPLGELNFSCDPQASLCVLTQGKNVAVATGNNCLRAFFSRKSHQKRLEGSPLPMARYLNGKTAYWYDRMEDCFGLEGFYNWDVTAAAWLTDPELFEPNPCSLTPTADSLKTGCLLGAGKPLSALLPRLRSAAAFEALAYERYLQVPANFDR